MITHNLKVKLQTVNDQMFVYRQGELIDVTPTVRDITRSIRRIRSREPNYLLIYIDKQAAKSLLKDMESMMTTPPSLNGLTTDEFGYLGKILGVNIITDAGSVEKYIKGCKLLVSDFPIILNAELIQQRKEAAHA
jgi:hypothetical protein